MKYYKFAEIEGGEYYPPLATGPQKPYKIGTWLRVVGKLEFCRRGYHAATERSIRYWYDSYARDGGRYAIYEVKIGCKRPWLESKSHAAYDEKICVHAIKLVKRVTIRELRRRGHWKL